MPLRVRSRVVQYVVGSVIAASIVLGILLVAFTVFGIYAGLKNNTRLLKVYGCMCVVLLGVTITGAVRCLELSDEAPTMVNKLSDNDIKTHFKLILTRDLLVNRLQIFFKLYVIVDVCFLPHTYPRRCVFAPAPFNNVALARQVCDTVGDVGLRPDRPRHFHGALRWIHSPNPTRAGAASHRPICHAEQSPEARAQPAGYYVT